MKAIKTKIIALLLIFTGAFLAFSCSTYKNGFLPPSSSCVGQEDSSDVDFSTLIKKKHELNIEFKNIINSINKHDNATQPIRARDINFLFQNLKKQYKIDSCFQYISKYCKNDSLKRLGRQNLILAADFYNSYLQENKSLRRIINRGDKGYSIGENTHLDSQYFLWKRKTQREIKTQNIKLNSSDKTKFDFIHQNRSDKIYNVFYKTFGFGSELLGHSLRKAYLKPNPKKNFKDLFPYLKKWDIICIKSPYRLTDKFIPGFFGHVGIYLGNNLFIESIQEGVFYSNSQEFAEGNTFVVIRPGNITSEQDKRMLQIAQAQIGKSYDFNFNVESSDLIFCSELIYLVYEQINWKTKKLFDYYTISPDYIVLEALENNKLFIPFYAKDGNVVINPDQMTIRELIQ